MKHRDQEATATARNAFEDPPTAPPPAVVVGIEAAVTEEGLKKAEA
jgi:hypothetical protein